MKTKFQETKKEIVEEVTNSIDQNLLEIGIKIDKRRDETLQQVEHIMGNELEEILTDTKEKIEV